MTKKAKKTNSYLLSWDMTGLETVLNLTQLEKDRELADKKRVWDILADPDLQDPGNLADRQLNQTVMAILMRARANTQRHYEVYTIHTDASISEQDMWDMFNSDPQYAADLIRERGTKLYSDRVNKRTQVIV